jgi:hypothetical protein
MKSIIKSVYTTVNKDFEELLFNVLKKEIQSARSTETNKKHYSIFHTFKLLVDGKTVDQHFIMHCEAALAAFAKYGPGALAKR